MKKITFTIFCNLILGYNLLAQFSPSSSQWNVPIDFEDYNASGLVSASKHTTMDLNGDGLPDLIDGIDNSIGSGRVWGNGTAQRYWKVYLNTGSGFSSLPIQWNVPIDFEDYYTSGLVSASKHTTMDIDGDGLPDLIDGIDNSIGSGRVWGNGTAQRYWKVYLNTGSGFSPVATQWNVPIDFEDYYTSGLVSASKHTTMDIDGDGLPDLIDGIDISSGNSLVWGNGTAQRYWKVYLNTGSGFSPVATQWNVPIDFEDYYTSGLVSSSNHTTMDVDGDGLPDLIDGIDISSGNSRVWGNGTSQYYWKVYLNTGNGFSSSPLQWNVPVGFEDVLESGRAFGSDHTTMDINGDKLPDLIDGIDISSGNSRVWGNGTSQYYWKVYLNTGSGFSSSALQWNVPLGFEDVLQSGRVFGPDHTTMDIDGDGLPDLIDGMDNSIGSGRVWGNGTSQRYWKVYFNEYITLLTSITVSGEGGASSVEVGSTLQMIANFLPANANDTTVTWSVSNSSGTATIDQNGVLTGVSEGSVLVFATANDASGVSAFATITVEPADTVSTSIGDITQASMSIYPNPVKDYLNVEVNTSISKLELIDVQGRVIASYGVKSNQFNLKVDHLKPGLYFLKLYGENQILQGQVLKE